ncbi:hypothetical protein KKI23_01220 [Patescibacteria group bacterium]|nr:hypothetical protein [Patescibacteria group bacterium]
MEDSQKIKAKIPIKKADGSFSVLEGEDFSFTAEQPIEPVKAQPILPKGEKVMQSAPPIPVTPPTSKPVTPPISTAPPQAPPSPYRPTLRPGQVRSQSKNAEFYYSREDQEEVKAEMAKLKEFGSGDLETDGERVTKQLIADYNLTFAEEIFRKRLIAIVNSRLKDIRDYLQTKEMLTRDVKVGGMGFNPDLVDKILAKIEAAATELHGKPLARVHEAKTPISQPTTPQPPKPPIPEALTRPVAKPISEPSKTTIAESPKPLPKKVIVQPRAKTLAKQAPGMPYVIRPSFEANKPRVEDIKQPTRVLSPIDEIRELSLLNFQRLADSSQGRIDKLTEKLDILQEDSYAKKAEGIKAWKQSPVYRLYIEIGQQSMVQGKAIEEIIRSRQQQNQPVITFDEFQLVADFNKSLRF